MSSRVLQRLSLSVAGFAAFIMVTGPIGCGSTPKKADIPESANLNDEVTNLSQSIEQGYAQNYDVLAQKDFAQAQSYLEDAKKELSKGEKREKVASSLGTARAYFERARQTASGLETRADGILQARTEALKAGARNSAKLQAELKSQDDAFRARISDLKDGKLSNEKWSDLQRGYYALELHAIQNAKLGTTKAKLDAAVANGAAKNTPRALAMAERDVRDAENVIAANRHDDQAIAPVVQRAEQSTQLLTEILAETKRPEGTINEEAARALVLQARKLHNMNARLDETSEKAKQLGQEAQQANAELQESAATVKLNHALESARKEFTSNEADVYRQGDKLLIRLKAVNFPVGRADLPSQALPLLSKVKSITEELNPSSVIVEGHTDSSGKKQFNKVLSQERAETVATYLADNGVEKDKINAIGYGYEKPLASNKSKIGRSENRRVDIVITPGPTTVGNSQQQQQQQQQPPQGHPADQQQQEQPQVQ